MNKWYRVKCSKCGAMIASLELGKTVLEFHAPLDKVKYKPNIMTKATYDGVTRSILCSICAGDSFDQTKFCTVHDIKEEAIKILNRESKATSAEHEEALNSDIDALDNKKLIDADKVCERLLKAVKVFRENAAFDEANGIFYAYEIIRDEWDRLTQDPKPLEKWGCIEDDNYAGGGYWECPSCKERFSFKGFNMLNDTPYCPKCGSRVEVEEW